MRTVEPTCWDGTMNEPSVDFFIRANERVSSYLIRYEAVSDRIRTCIASDTVTHCTGVPRCTHSPSHGFPSLDKSVSSICMHFAISDCHIRGSTMARCLLTPAARTSHSLVHRWLADDLVCPISYLSHRSDTHAPSPFAKYGGRGRIGDVFSITVPTIAPDVARTSRQERQVAT